MSKYPLDLTGVKFGRLTVLTRQGSKPTPNGRSQSLWLCKCDCGNNKVIGRNALVNGFTLSCGCLNQENRKKRALPSDVFNLHRILNYMKTRCYNHNSKYYPNYGGRGIEVCDEWLASKDAFVQWALSHGYERGLTIERINNDEGYSPSNCKWIPKKEQALNRRSTIRIPINGREYFVNELSKMTGLSANTIRARYKRYGFDGEQILLTPKNAKVRVNDVNT